MCIAWCFVDGDARQEGDGSWCILIGSEEYEARVEPLAEELRRSVKAYADSLDASPSQSLLLIQTAEPATDVKLVDAKRQSARGSSHARSVERTVRPPAMAFFLLKRWLIELVDTECLYDEAKSNLGCESTPLSTSRRDWRPWR